MDELKFFLGLSAVTLMVVGLVIYFGMRLNRAITKNAPEINFPLKVTMTGTVLWACVVGFWVICAIARELRPDSSFGDFLNTTDGFVSVIVGSILFAVIAGAILEKLGYPIARKGSDS